MDPNKEEAEEQEQKRHHTRGNNDCTPTNGIGIAKTEPNTEVDRNKDSYQGNPKMERLKYVPGPIGSLIDQAAVVGLQLQINADNDLVFGREEREPIPLIG